MDTMGWISVAGSRWMLFAVTIVGMAMCAGGIGRAARLGLWLHPVTLAGYALGGLALLLAAQGLLRLPMVPLTTGQALLGILGIIAVKVALARLYGV